MLCGLLTNGGVHGALVLLVCSPSLIGSVQMKHFLKAAPEDVNLLSSVSQASLLHIAARAGSDLMVYVLLARGANVRALVILKDGG